MTHILAIETCSEHLSVCLMERNSGAMTQKSELAYRNLSDNLHPFIDDVLRMAGKTPQDISLLACTRGPGSFTSVRVGIATIKGLRLALGVDAVTLPSLELIALPHFHQQKPICAWLDTHGGNVYMQTFNSDGTPLSNAASLPANEAAMQTPEGAILVGSGVVKHPQHVPDHAIVPERETSSEKTLNALRYGDVLRLAKEAQHQYDANTNNVNNFDILYVHPLNYDKVGAV